MKKLCLCLCLALCCATLNGCWDYRGLDELTIVAGIAIDSDEENPNGYAVAFEIVDMSSDTQEGLPSKLVETKGATITEAVYNANKKLNDNMFFGNTEMLIVSESIARDKGLQVIVDPLLRDNSIRDNLTVLVSREKTAKEIITPQEDNPQIVSYILNEAIGSGQEIAFSANSTRALELDQIYNDLVTEKYQLALPAICFSNPEKKELCLDGLALFNQDKAVGFLSDDELPWYLLAIDKLSSGSIDTFLQTDNTEDPLYYSLVIRKSEPKRNFEFDGQTFTFTIEIRTTTALSELSKGWGKITDTIVQQMETRTETVMNEQILLTLEDVRDNYGTDTLGFADTVNRGDPALWQQVKDNWEYYYTNCEIKVKSDVFIHDTGLMKNF